MKRRSGLNIMLRLVGLVKPLARYMLVAIVMGIAGHLAAASITILGAYAVLCALGLNVPFSIGSMFVAVCVLALLRGVLRYAEQACNHYIAFKLLALIREKVFLALRRLCPAKLEGRDRGDLISVITSDIELLEVFYAHTISPIVIACVFSLIMCVYIGNFSLTLGLMAMLAYVVVGAVIPLLISKLSGDDGMNLRTMSGNLSAVVLDGLRGLQEILQFGYGCEQINKVNRMTDELADTEKRMKDTTGRNQAITNTVIMVCDLTMLFMSAGMYVDGIVGLEGVIMPTVALMSSFGPVIALANLGSTLQNTLAAGNRVLDILDETPVTEEITGEDDIEFTGACARDVTFSYGEEAVLKNMSVDIPKGKVIGITGRSGTGKSTLLKLFMRFWKADEGCVSVSGMDVNRINTANLRDMESFLTQETHLFNDSISNNIRIAKLTATDEEIVKACRKASIHDFIMSLPQGYDTPVGELGEALSGGERQRLGLARAFLHDADMMLLDEPTSNLDSLNEAVILKSLGEESSGKTVVLVSHRKSTMRIVDREYCVEHRRMS